MGLTYLAPLVPVGLTPETADRFLIVSFANTIFGIIELVIFTVTVQPRDVTFDRPFWVQLFGHVAPIVAALVGMSFVARGTPVPVSGVELSLIVVLFVTGSVLRVVAVSQLGALGFKFDIAFRDQQALKTDQLYGWMRHPSYFAMMLVILAYAVATHSWAVGTLGTGAAFFGFQFRIYFEEKALLAQYGRDYQQYREKTGMWFPFGIPGRGKK